MTGRPVKRDRASEADIATAHIRLECLKLTRPDTSAPDIKRWLAAAQQLEDHCFDVGQAPAPTRKSSKGTQRGGDKAEAPMLLGQ